MGKKLLKILLVIFALLSFGFSKNQILAQTEEVSQILESSFDESQLPKEPKIQGQVEGIGKFFEIKDSEYLNVKLESREEITVILESIPRMISIDISSSTASFTQLTISGLEPNKTYYKYQDSYKNGAVFVSNENGSYSWQQELTEPHHVWFQEKRGTIFIPDQCLDYGTWDPESLTCTLTQDLTESVEITTNGVTFDCGGHKITGPSVPAWIYTYGIYLRNKEEIIIKNCKVEKFTYGFYIDSSSSNTLSGNTANFNYNGITLWFSSNNLLKGNIAEANHSGINLSSSGNNVLTENKMAYNSSNFNLFGSSDDHFVNTIDTSNTVNDKSIYYLQNANNQIYDSRANAGVFYCIFCNGVVVEDLTLTSNAYGIFFWKTNNSKIEGVDTSYNEVTGIQLSYSNNNTILNNQDKRNGFYLFYSNDNILSNNWGAILLSNSNYNNLTANTAGVIYLKYSNNNNLNSNNARLFLLLANDNTLINNTASDKEFCGICIWGSNTNTLDGNIVSRNKEWGVYLSSSANNILRNNIISENLWNFSISGRYLSHFTHDIDTSNKINGKSIQYLVNKNDLVINSSWDVGYLGVVNSTNITVKDLTLTGNAEGLLFAYSTDSNIENVNVSNAQEGIILYSSNNIAIVNNTVTKNEFYGISLLSSNKNNIANNNLIENGYGIYLDSSNENILNNNAINSNKWHGIYLYSSSNNILNNNNLNSNKWEGLSIYSSNNNLIYHNNFSGNNLDRPSDYWNPYQALIVFGVNNSFDNSYPAGGNYWSDYKGVDEKSGPNQDQPSSDGIGDSPYCFEGGCDRYPFMKESGWEALLPEKWSFALITDLHIGWGIPDYDDESYNDSAIGQNYYITERLKKAIQWINENYKNPDYNIKFVVVDGDISDTAEYSEFLTARNILNQLEIPYIPIIGNHDIWPYIQKSTCDPDGFLGRWNTIKDKRKENEPLGDEYFETVFWKDNSTNTQKIKTLFGKFERQEEKEGYQGSPYFQNYIFDYGGVTFIALDFVSREYENLIPPASLTTDLNGPTLNWFESSVESGGDKKIIVFTHQPIASWPSWRPIWFVEKSSIERIINKCNCTVFDFAGHTHVNGVPVKEMKINGSEFNVIETEALLQSKNPEVAQLLIGMPPAPAGEFIKVIQIKNKENQDVNYGILINGFPKAINPYITTNKEELAVGESITFYAHTKNLKPEEILSYDWDFDRNYSSQCVFPEDKYSQCIVAYKEPGTYKVSLKVIPKSDPSYFEEISWNLKVKEKAKPRWKLFLPTPGIIPLLNGEEDVILTEQDNAQNTPEWVLITKVTSPAKPIGAFEVHFENANQDIDLSNLVADTNLDTKKSILYMHEWPEEIENSKVLFLPISK